MGTGEFTAGGNPAMGGLASHPGGRRNTPTRFTVRNRNKVRPDGPLGSYADYLTWMGC